MQPPDEQAPIEVEVVRLPRDGETPPASRAPRWRRALRPLLAGLFLDLVNYATPTPGLGFFLGALAGWWVGGRLGLPLTWRLALCAGSAAYCAIPGRQPLPLGTILGAFCRIDLEALRASPRRDA